MKTARLELLRWVPEHDRLLVAWASDPAIMRFIGDGSLWSESRALDVAEHQRTHWEQHGFGWRVAVVDGEPIGFIMLSFAGEGAGVDADEYEIGWWLVPSAWGHGYAREGAAALCDEAFGIGAPSVVARIQRANAASIAVAEAIGMRYERMSTGRGGEPIAIYRVSFRR